MVFNKFFIHFFTPHINIKNINIIHELAQNIAQVLYKNMN